MTTQITDKQTMINSFNRDMLNKTLTMFDYTGLPDSIPAVELEKLLQQNGYAVIAKCKDSYYAFSAGFSGQDAYNQPTTAIISNPALNFNANLDIGTECVLIKNNDLQVNITHLFDHYGTLLNENEITMLLTDYNERIQTLISASDDSTVASAQEYIKEIKDGQLGVIGESRLFDSLKVNNANQTGSSPFADLTAYQQYLMATLNNEIGLATNNNMKRERLTTNEIDVNQNATYPLVDNMLRNRQAGLDQLKKVFQLDCDVEFNSIWSQDDTDRDVAGSDSNTNDEPDSQVTPPFDPNDNPDDTPDDTPDNTPDDTPDNTPDDDKPTENNEDDNQDDQPDETHDDNQDDKPDDDKPDDDKPDDNPDDDNHDDDSPDETPDDTPDDDHHDETPDDDSPDETPDDSPKDDNHDDDKPDDNPDETPDDKKKRGKKTK